MIGRQTEQSVPLHDQKQFIPGDTCSAYILIKDLMHFDNTNCELFVRAHYENEIYIDCSNGVKVPDWLMYRALHSLPSSPKRTLEAKFNKFTVSVNE